MNEEKMQKSETSKFDEIAYKKQYDKEHYKNINLKIKKEDHKIIEQFCQDLQISKNKFLINCALYAIDNNMIDEIRAYKPRED